MKRVYFFSVAVLLAAMLMGWLIWEQEVKYALPTPIPNNFSDVKLGEQVDLNYYGITAGRITMLHFFNPDCACSRFNMKEFARLSAKYKNDAQVYVVIQSADEEDAKRFESKYDLKLPIIMDKDGVISDKCGIYSTPQSVLLGRESKLYFKGNYNTARYCTRKETSFAEIAMTNLIEGKPLPLWLTTELTMPYGCSLPSDEKEEFEITTFFK